MDTWIQTLANIGGVGGMAIMLYFLHRDSVKSFGEQLQKERELYREEMAATRQGNQALWQAYMELKLRQHEQIFAAIVAQDKVLSEIKSTLDYVVRESARPPREV